MKLEVDNTVMRKACRVGELPRGTVCHRAGEPLSEAVERGGILMVINTTGTTIKVVKLSSGDVTVLARCQHVCIVDATVVLSPQEAQ